MKPLLIVLDDWEGRISASSCWNRLKDFVDIKYLKEPIENINNSEIEHAEFLLAIRERTALTEKVFSRLPNLKLIMQTGGHAYHIDTAAAMKHGVAIALGRRGKAPLVSVPELTFSMILGVLHLLPQAHIAMRTGQWPLLTGRTLSNRRIGILGMGRHGSRVAHIAGTSFNMDVVAWNRPGSDYDKNDGVRRLPLDELLETSDVVSIHLRLSKESTGLINTERLQKMKRGAILINTSRGAIVDEKSIIEALTKGPLAGAGLDVFAHEPLAVDSPLRSLDNVILTPHIGWTVEEVFEEFAQIACTQLFEYLNNTLAPTELLLFP
jgi:D-3-phosphoglycerate dehydrogenase / 2-oxoglutarate reductase